MTSIGWKSATGARPYRVVAEERLDRDRVVYLRWWEGKRWTRSATGIKVWSVSLNRLVQAKVDAVESLMLAKQRDLINGISPKVIAKPLLTISAAITLVKDAESGLYPLDSPHRREVLRELARAAAILGEEKTWNSMTPSDLAKIYRRRAQAIFGQGKGKAGRRGAEISVARLLTVAEWLRGEKLIEQTACRVQHTWRSLYGSELELKLDKEILPARPRHEVPDIRKLLDVAGRVDPRLALALELGTELRLGQVLRARRSDLRLESNSFRVRGRGRKAGTIVELIPTQLAAVKGALSGHLAALETLYETGKIEDYPLFPSGQMTGGRRDVHRALCRPSQASAPPIHRRAVLAWFHEAERLAGIPQVKGRGWYGLRRASVDGAKAAEISPDGLKQFGGWSGTEIPEQVYAEKQSRRSIEEASKVRAKIRGPAPVNKSKE